MPLDNVPEAIRGPLEAAIAAREAAAQAALVEQQMKDQATQARNSFEAAEAFSNDADRAMERSYAELMSALSLYFSPPAPPGQPTPPDPTPTPPA